MNPIAIVTFASLRFGFTQRCICSPILKVEFLGIPVKIRELCQPNQRRLKTTASDLRKACGRCSALRRRPRPSPRKNPHKNHSGKGSNFSWFAAKFIRRCSDSPEQIAHQKRHGYIQNPRPDMMAEIPSGAFQIPDYAFWMIGGWVLTALISGFSGYRWGLRSQQQAARLHAKNAACAFIDRIAADFWDNPSLWSSHGKHSPELQRLTLEFSSQFAESDRVRIKKALDDYQKLYVTSFGYPVKGTPEREMFDREHKAMKDGLKHLRDEISNT
jgi:hypothetical protein